MKLWSRPASGLIKIAGLLAVFAIIFGQEAAAAPAVPQVAAPVIDPAALSSMRTGIDTVWVLVAAMLVFWMNAGFALVESGLCRSKNCVNILTKNFSIVHK